MMHDAPERASFPVSPENTPTKRRAVFSASFAGLTSHHVQPDTVASTSRRGRNLDDDSLRLIDDLTNRPMDVMYTDSRLATKTPSMFSVWFTRVLVFLICIAVGTAGSVFVRQLSTDPRKEVRKQLSSQLAEQTKNVETLTKDVNALRAQVEEESKSVSNWSLNQTIQDDEMVNGILPVQGEGITLTIANPLSVSGDNADSSLPRENGSQVRVVTDSDLQVLVSAYSGRPERKRSPSTDTVSACRLPYERLERRFSSESIPCKVRIASRQSAIPTFLPIR